MTFVITGRIKSIGSDAVDIEDLESGKTYSCYIESEQRASIKEGQTGLFLGEDSSSGLVVRRVNYRKIVDPLQEEDLMRASATMPTIRVKNDPFSKIKEEILNG